MRIERHFTSSIYIVYRGKVLLHLHKKYNMILPVGGHLEMDELPEEGAIREAKEESGLDVILYNDKIVNDFKSTTNKELITPMHSLLIQISPTHHHIDLSFYAYATTFNVNPMDGESDKLMWLDPEEIKNNEAIKEDVKIFALEAISLVQ